MSQRRGFSLLEILLALAILGGSLAILSRISERGTSAARESTDLVVARLMCQSMLSQTLIDATTGVTPQPVNRTPIEPFDSQTSSEFVYSIEVQPATIDNLLQVRVTVEAVNPGDGPALATYSLLRWMVDPAAALEQAEADEQALIDEMMGESDGGTSG